MAKIFGRIMRIAKKKFGLRKKSKVISVDCGSQTNTMAEEIVAPIKSVTEINILESQIKEVADIAVQTSLFTSDKLTQTNNKLMYNLSETQTEMSLFNSLSCETQTDVSIENLILNTKSLDEPHNSNSKLINYMHTGSQCSLLSTKNEPLLKVNEFREHDLQSCTLSPLEAPIKVNNCVEDGINPSTTLNDTQEKIERCVTKSQITAEVDATYDLSIAEVEFNKKNSNEVLVNKQNVHQVENRLQFYTLDNVPKLQLRNNYVYSMRVLYCQTDYICMTKAKNEQKIRFIENNMNAHYKQTQDCNFKPRHDELCAVKYSDGSWYRGVCIDIENSVDRSQFYIINLIDWGESVSVPSSELRRLEMFYMKHAPLAVKCIILDFKLSNAHQKNLRKLENNEYKCKINLRLSPRNFLISSKTILDILRNR
ncbi:uncharacterized protein LOC126900503 [Daktulosphaira vitifoliae]|uniref:uncharacterized protein LOC126900503 n=1 Tax=Daktulosphaira vitifoliae TaxID=58002 RepID=UPI0021AAF36C|nr:uncharacterized protein LOC126900503 [Daktulosphaira vitifoliae]